MAGGTWIKLYSNVFSHKKTFILADKLKINETYAAAHLIRLWTWAVDNTKDGNLSGIPYQLIAKAADWPKNPDLFVSSCIAAGWLESDDYGNLVIHDWDEYTETLIRRRERDADRKRTERKNRKDVRNLSEGRPADCPKDVQNPRVEKSRVEKSRVDITTLGSTEDRGSSSIQQVDMSAASDHSSSQPDDLVTPVFKAYERDIGIPSGTVMDKLKGLITADGLDSRLVIAAIAEASECNKRSFRYVEGILNRCLSDGIKTEEQFKAQKIERSSSRFRQPDVKKQPSEQEYGWPVDESKLPDFMRGGDGS